MNYRLLPLLFILLLSNNLVSQTPGYWHLSDKDGLPSNTIYHIIEDKNGYICLGTSAGLTRFNGFKCQTIANPNSKSSDASDLCLDKQGNIWFSNFNHELFKFNHKSQIIEKIEGVNHDNFNAQGKFDIDHLDNIWFTNNKNIYFYNSAEKNIKTIADQISPPYSFGLYGNNELIFGSVKFYKASYSKYPEIEITELNTESNKLEKPILLYDVKKQFILPVYYNINNVPDGLKILDLNQFPSIKSVQNICLLKDNSIWICTSDGVVIFNENGELSNNKVLLKGKNVSYAYLDSKNNYWVATLNEGLFMISDFNINSFEFYNENHQLNGVSCLTVFQDNLLVGTQNGKIIKFNKNNEQVEYDLIFDRSIYNISNIDNQMVLINQKIFNSGFKPLNITYNLSAAKDFIHFNKYYILSNNSGLRFLDKDNLFKNKIESDNITLNIEIRDENNKILNNSVKLFNRFIIEGRADKLFMDSKQRIWINSSSGIYCLILNTNTLIKYEFSYNKNALALDFAEDNKGLIYLAIANEGIVILGENGLIKKYSTKDGLLNSNARKILWKNNRLWIATANGLNSINTLENKVYDIRIADGILSNDIQDICWFNNKIWIATFKGLSSLKDDFIPSNPSAPSIFLLKTEVNGNEYTNSSNEFKYNQNNLGFYFEGINYKSRQLMFYKYRLKGLSNNWISLSGNNNYILFQGLEPDDYNLEIIAYNDKGIASEPLQYSFKITKPIWLKTWFWLLVILLIIVFLFFYIRNLQFQKNKKIQLENDLRISQLTSLKAQMNPHFMFNALNSIQDFILLNDKKSANMYLGKFSDLMRLILDMSNQLHVLLTHEFKALKLYLELESLRFEESFTYEIVEDKNLDPSEWKIPSMIIQPFVENAIKHGLLHKRGERKLWVYFDKKEDENTLKVVIKDNGIGRKAAEQINLSKSNRHQSFATGATERRLTLLNQNIANNIEITYQDILDSNQNPSGTSVTINIPLIPNNNLEK